MSNQRPVRWLAVAVAVAALGILFLSPAQAQKKEATKAAVSTFLVVSPHTAEECLVALDGVVASGKDALDNWYWGCKAGDHTGYEIVKAESGAKALETVPENLRSKARAMKLNRFTTEEVASFHEMTK
jgi:hypothetical protein